MKRLYKAIKFYLAELVFKKRTEEIESSEVIERLKECLECDFNNLGSCSSCGCVIKAKVYCPHCECPEGFWSKVKDNGRDTSK